MFDSRKPRMPVMNRRDFARATLAGGTLAALSPLVGSAGTILTDKDLAGGKSPRIGDTVILSDFTTCFPRAAIGSKSEKGKWWLKPYRTAGGQRGAMLCVEERDRENPQQCVAPALTYNTHLEGIYEIWVGTYRTLGLGGVDIRLSRDKIFAMIDPAEDGVDVWPPADEKIGRIVECFYKTADMSGQNIHLRQPHGTYSGFWWGFAQSHIAYIKLIRRDPVDVKRQADRRASLDHRGVMVDNDGFSFFYEYGTDSVGCILQQIEPFSYGNVESLNWCFGDSLRTYFPHPMSAVTPVTGDRLGDKRAEHTYKFFRENKVDILQTLVDRCHEIGLKIYVSQRANSADSGSSILNEHPEWRGTRKPDTPGIVFGSALDYANPELQAYLVRFLAYIPRNYDIDGLTIDLTRHPPFFKEGAEVNSRHMTGYLRALRAELDRVGQERGKHFALNVTFENGVFYRNWMTAEQQGLDVQAWIHENLVDCLMPEGRDIIKYIKMCRGTRTKCYPRRGGGMTFDGDAVNREQTWDPTSKDNNVDRYMEAEYTPLQIADGILKWYDAIADGIFMFNYVGQTTLRNLPYPEILREEVKSQKPFGRRIGDKVMWDDGNPRANSNTAEHA